MTEIICKYNKTCTNLYELYVSMLSKIIEEATIANPFVTIVNFGGIDMLLYSVNHSKTKFNLTELETRWIVHFKRDSA
jgi:hypothetical protein